MLDQPDHDLAHSTRPLTIDGIALKAPIGEMLTEWARKWGTRIALVHGDESMTYAALDHRVDRLAGALQNSRLKKGDRILIQMPNSIGLVTTLLAALRLGINPIMAMPAQRLHDLSALVANAQPVAYFAARELHGFQYEVLARSLQQAHPFLRLIVLDGTDVSRGFSATSRAGCAVPSGPTTRPHRSRPASPFRRDDRHAQAHPAHPCGLRFHFSSFRRDGGCG